MLRTGALKWAWIACAFSGACSTAIDPDADLEAGAAGGDGSGSKAITYEKDVKAILEARCTSCHQEGGIGPMPLVDYAQVKAWRFQIKQQVVSRSMPPWTAGQDCNHYLGDRSLSDEQIDLIAGWVDRGAPEGEPLRTQKQRGKPAQDPLAFRADVSLRMPEYTPVHQPDDYRCFILDWPESKPAYITGIALRPGNPQMVHHTVVNLVAPSMVQAYRDRDAMDPGPGYECFTTGVTGGQSLEAEGGTVGVGGSGTQLLGALEKREDGSHFPYGTGIGVLPGSVIVMQQHYNTLPLGGPEPDLSTLELMVEQDVINPGRAAWLVNPLWANRSTKETMHIPAHEPDASVNVQMPGAVVGGRDFFDIYWADLHMHTLGSRGELKIIRADNTEECLLRVDDWKFEWQETYFLKNPISMGPGDRLSLECHWDNTAENQFIVDGERLPVQDVWWGDGSRDEMCLGNFLVVAR